MEGNFDANYLAGSIGLGWLPSKVYTLEEKHLTRDQAIHAIRLTFPQIAKPQIARVLHAAEETYYRVQNGLPPYENKHSLGVDWNDALNEYWNSL